MDNVYKGFSFYRLSHDCHFDIDRDVSTAHCRSSSGDDEDLPDEDLKCAVETSRSISK